MIIEKSRIWVEKMVDYAKSYEIIGYSKKKVGNDITLP